MTPAQDQVYEQRIERLDLSLFDSVPTQSTAGDRLSWLALQRAVRGATPGYTYLEIGSYNGGSIQQHLLDPLCSRVYSIDRRSIEQPDARGDTFYRYEGNTTRRMMDNLRAVSPDADAKVLCFDNDARDLDPGEFRQCPQFCFIDGEHTKSAVESDFDFCLKVSDPNAAIAFHDDYVTADAIQAVIDRLAGDKVPFRALKMGGQTFVIALRDCPVATDPLVLENSVDGLKWLRRCRTVGLAKAWLPVWLKPAAQSVFRAVAGRPAT